MARIPLQTAREESGGVGRCHPALPPDLIARIPLEWVGGEGAWAPAAGTQAAAPLATSAFVPASVIASPAAAAEQIIAPPGYFERRACVLEPGKPCRSSGRCARMGL